MPESRPIPSTAVPRLAIGAVAVLVASLAVVHGVPTPSAGTQPAAAQPQPFAAWPKNTKPDAVLVITGQTFGYLQPCGCSRPQLGGLERRANFIAGLKARGWPVAGVDLGDVMPVGGGLLEQRLMKYATTMNALREMGYVAVGVGKAEITNGLFQVLDQYAVKKEQMPYTLAGNAVGVDLGKVTPRAKAFPGPGNRPLIGMTEVVEVGTTPVGIAGVVGPTVFPNLKALFAFTLQKDTLDAAVKELAAHAKKPQLNVLLYQGTLDEAKAVAKDFPQFSVIVHLSPEGEAAETPITVTAADGRKTLLIQVGYKGQDVGVVGAFKNDKGGLDLKYQLVSLGESFVTPGDEVEARKANPALVELDNYANRVKAQNLIGKFPQDPPPGQTENPKLRLTYVGNESCVKCHEAEHTKWKATPHSHAFETLEKAKRPALRQFDGECVICHTVGLSYKTGYRDDLTTPHLKNVGCESCHGPGSGHAADPKDAKYLALQSPWRQARADRLPDVATMERLAKALAKLEDLPPAEQQKRLQDPALRLYKNVSRMCESCHNHDNDPYFDLAKYWPKVVHPAKK